MKQLVCEMCGSTDLVKQDGVFVCQSCGCKYSVEEAKKMMIEGVVEVTGTVKIDDNDQIANLLKNAKRAFEDGRMKQAQQLYSQILIKQPDNVEAVLYEGLSMGWQSNTMHSEMRNAVDGAKRALGLAKKDTEIDFKSFALEVAVNITSLGASLINLYLKDANEKVALYTKDLDSLKKMLGYSTSYFEHVKEIGNSKIEQMHKFIANMKANNDNVIIAILDVYDAIFIQIFSAEYLDEKFILCLADSMDKIPNEATGYSAQHRLANTKGKYKELLNTCAENARQERIDNYWKEHSEEKAKLDEEKSALEDKLKSLGKQYKDVLKKRDNVDSLRKERDKKLPEVVELEKQQEYVDDLQRRKDSLGIFKGKEKKALQAQIEQEQVKLENIKENADLALKKHKEELNKQINEAKSFGQDIIDEYKSIRSRISEIDALLTQDRKPEIADIGPFDTDEEGTSSADNMYVSLDNIDPDYIKSSFGDRKVEAIRYVREQTGISLKEAKEYVDKIYTRECVKGETANGTNEDFYKAIRSLPGADVFGTRKEIRHLQEIMLDGEVVNAVSSGIMNNHTWLMASTNKRVLLVNKNFLVGMQQMEIPLNQINAISYTMGIVFSTITISHGGASMRIENVQKGSEKYFVEATNKAIREYGVNINVINPQPVTPAFSSADEIRKFKELLDMGAITQEEFEAKKKQLLGL